MTQRFYTSDVHAGHQFVAGTRGFASSEEHDREVARRWNKRVRPEDDVWVLGDVALGKRVETLKIFDQMNGTKYLVWGNHDNGFPGHVNSWKQHRMYLEYFAAVAEFAVHKIGEHRVMLSHFPYTADHTGEPPRYMEYRLRDEGRFLLHGHLHSKEKITSQREVHVGLDAWDLYPVPQHEILGIIRKLAGEQQDVTREAAPV